MDTTSHEYFAEILLDCYHKKDDIYTSSRWGTAPDLDMIFLHRWHRHRISVLPKIHKEFSEKYIMPIEHCDKDKITLCIVSHLYLDIFNGSVMPFGAIYPILPEDTIINNVLDNINEPKILIKKLISLSGSIKFNVMFYKESRGIMKEFAKNLSSKYTIQGIIELIVRRLSSYAESNYTSIYEKAMYDIAKFTGDINYNFLAENNKNEQDFDIFEKFEIEYVDLINRTSG